MERLSVTIHHQGSLGAQSALRVGKGQAAERKEMNKFATAWPSNEARSTGGIHEMDSDSGKST